MFRLVFILQCKSSGEFLTINGFYTYNLNQAGLFPDKQSALDTGVSALESDFMVYPLYKKESELPPYLGGASGLRVSAGSMPPP